MTCWALKVRLMSHEQGVLNGELVRVRSDLDRVRGEMVAVEEAVRTLAQKVERLEVERGRLDARVQRTIRKSGHSQEGN